MKTIIVRNALKHWHQLWMWLWHRISGVGLVATVCRFVF